MALYVLTRIKMSLSLKFQLKTQQVSELMIHFWWVLSWNPWLRVLFFLVSKFGFFSQKSYYLSLDQARRWKEKKVVSDGRPVKIVTKANILRIKKILQP